MVSIFNRFQSPIQTRGGKKDKMGSCPDFNTQLGGIFQHHPFVKTDDIKTSEEFLAFNSLMELDELFNIKISYNY